MIGGLLKRIKLDAATDALERWRQQAEWAAGLTGTGIVRVRKAAAGPVLSVDGPGTRMVQLTGSSSPYGGTEVYAASSGTWASLPSAPAMTSVYEDDGLGGLSGKVVRVRPGSNLAAGEWRFRYNRNGGGTPPTCGTIGVTVKCGGTVPVAGITVTVSLGGTVIGVCTTDVTGKCSVPVSAIGLYTVSASGTNFTTASTTCNVNSCVRATFPVSIAITPVSGYNCIPDRCCGTQTGPPYQSIVWPTTLFFNDGIGTVSCGSASSASAGPWFGTATRTSNNGGYDCSWNGLTGINDHSVGFVPGPVSVTLYYEISCTNPGDPTSWGAAIGWYGCKSCNSTGCTGSCSNSGTTGSGGGGGCTSSMGCNYVAGPPVAGNDISCIAVAPFGVVPCAGPGAAGASGAGVGDWCSLSPTTSVGCPPTAIAQGGFITDAYKSPGNCDTIMGFYLAGIYGSSLVGGLNRVSIPVTVTS